MALPTLPSYWCSRRLLDQQAARQRQREQEARLRQQWEQNSHYFRRSDVCSAKQAQWSSKNSYQRSMHAYQREKMKEEKRKALEARRERLRQLLLEEQDLLAQELEELRLSMNLRERRIRERHGNLKSAREEQRKLVTVGLRRPWRGGNASPEGSFPGHPGLRRCRLAPEPGILCRVCRLLDSAVPP